MRTRQTTARQALNTPASPTELTLYSRSGCHLCDDMLETLQGFGEELSFTIRVVDIDADQVLRTRFNTLVPVLALGENEICHYFLDKVALCRALEKPET